MNINTALVFVWAGKELAKKSRGQEEKRGREQTGEERHLYKMRKTYLHTQKQTDTHTCASSLVHSSCLSFLPMHLFIFIYHQHSDAMFSTVDSQHEGPAKSGTLHQFIQRHAVYFKWWPYIFHLRMVTFMVTSGWRSLAFLITWLFLCQKVWTSAKCIVLMHHGLFVECLLLSTL